MVGTVNLLGALHVLAVVLAAIAAACIAVAIAGMATAKQSVRAGWWVRLLALACFIAAAVVLNVVDRAH